MTVPLSSRGSSGDIAPDTKKSSVVTDHAFVPRTGPSRAAKALHPRNTLQPNPYLCQICRLAEAAHAR